MNLHAFPTTTDRARIHDLIRLNAYGKLSRVHMDEVITQILYNYKLSKIYMDGYTVRRGEPIQTPIGEWPVVYIETQRVAPSPNCPACGGRPEYLDADVLITAACLNCGIVYKYKDVEEEPTGEPEKISEEISQLIKRCLKMVRFTKEVEQGANPQDVG